MDDIVIEQILYKFFYHMTYMDDTKTKTKKELEILFILTGILFLFFSIISLLSNIAHLQLLNNISLSIMLGSLGIYVYFALIDTINIRELFSAFLLNTLASFLFFSMLYNTLLKLFGSLYMVFVLTPLTLSLIFDSITKNARIKIITLMAILSIAVFISPTPFTFLAMVAILSAVILTQKFVPNKKENIKN